MIPNNKMRDAFSTYHPIVNFAYFTFVLLFSMFFMHPVCLAISLCAAVCYSVYLNGKKALKFNIKYMLPMLLITAIINPAFNHEGATVLMYFSSGNPLTLESIIYGISAAMMLVTVIGWFSCCNNVMTSDKFIYLFGRVIPALSLIFSMVMRFVPRFNAQFLVVSNAQKCMGNVSDSVFSKLRQGVKILSIMITWMLENAIETADSMKNRGYGLKGRTAFSIFKFDARDRIVFSVILCFGFYVLAGAFFGGMYFRYFPSMKGTEISIFTVSQFMSYGILCFLPLCVNIWEERKWKLLQSKI